MLGLGGSGGLELYWRRDVRQPGDRHRLWRLPGLAVAVERLQSALRDWTGAGLDDPIERRSGLSVKLARDGSVVAVAAFLRASAVCEPDRLLRRLLDAGGEGNPALGNLWAQGRLRPGRRKTASGWRSGSRQRKACSLDHGIDRMGIPFRAETR